MADATDSSARRESAVNNFSCQNKNTGESWRCYENDPSFAAMQRKPGEPQRENLIFCLEIE